MFFLVTVSFND